MSRALPVLLGLLLVGVALPLAAPPAEAISCRDPNNPFPASPVGGVVGQVYTFGTGTAYNGAVTASRITCATAIQAIGTVNSTCYFLIGAYCLDVA